MIRPTSDLIAELRNVADGIAAQANELANRPNAPKADQFALNLDGARRLALSLAERIRREAAHD